MDRLGISGAPVHFLSLEHASDLAFTRAAIAPGRGMMLLQAWGRLPDRGEVELIEAPPLTEAAALLDAGGADDFAGNLAFSFGGAILLPYANRIRGEAAPDVREIQADIAGRSVRLPRNWGGRTPGAEQYAMHGLILDRAPQRLHQPAANRLEAEFDLGDFEGRWPSRTTARVIWALEERRLKLAVTLRNDGDELLPAGLGWHPYFKLPSGDRSQARLRLPASHRLAVNDYDEVLPTGGQIAVAGTPYDFSGPEGAPLSRIHLDDCFVGLRGGEAVIAIADPLAGYVVRLIATAPPIRAIQVYAPVDRAIVVVEPQTNWADPFGLAWASQCPPIPLLAPGETLDYDVVTELASYASPTQPEGAQ